MSSTTLNENIWFVINEKFIDFEDLKDKGFNLSKIIHKRKLNGYFDILHGPIYINLIKEFWLNASVGIFGHDVDSIQSYVNDSPITITQSLIIKTINCEEEGCCVEHYRFNKVYSDHLRLIYANYDNLSSHATLLPIGKVLYQLLVSNLCLRDKQLGTLTWDDNHLLLFLTKNIIVNLPLTIFNFLKKMIIISREEMNFHIPYGRVLSELFSQLEIVNSDTIEVEWSQNFEYVG